MPKTPRTEPPDTVDALIRLLAGLQAEGWSADRIAVEWDYRSPGHKQRAIPVGMDVRLRLRIV